MKTMQATDLRRNLFRSLEEIAATRSPVEILRFKRSVAILTPSPELPAERRKPLVDLNAIARFCKDHQIKSFALFGSILRDDFDEHSDVDVLIDLQGRRLKFHEECGMLDELEIIFGRKVDMVQTDILNSPRMNEHRKLAITSTAKVVYDATA
jgi:Predicted nucleotidyltransferases